LVLGKRASHECKQDDIGLIFEEAKYKGDICIKIPEDGEA